jgi:hypothetical protein
MLAATLLALALTADPNLPDFVDALEIGPADHFVAFDSGGKYRAEQLDAKRAKLAELRGRWTLKDDTVEVKLIGCTGPSCKDLKKDYRAHLELAADRALLIQSNAPGVLLESGAYYCHYQGCEKRIGVVLASKDAKPRTMNYLLDFLIDQNRPRNSTVVWWKRQPGDAGKTRIEYCTREAEKAKAGAAQVAADLATLPWIGKLEPAASAEAGCLWDVRVVVADDVVPAAKPR